MATLFDAEGNEFEIDDALLAPDPEERKPQTPSEWAALRRANTAQKNAEKEAAAAKRDLAFLKAGIDPEDTRLSYFVKGYDGPFEVEKIKEAAVAAGFLQAPEQTPEQQAAQQALGASQRIAGAAVAAQAAPSADMARRQALEDAYKAGGMEGLTAAMNAVGIPSPLN